MYQNRVAKYYICLLSLENFIPRKRLISFSDTSINFQ